MWPRDFSRVLLPVQNSGLEIVSNLPKVFLPMYISEPRYFSKSVFSCIGSSSKTLSNSTSHQQGVYWREKYENIKNVVRGSMRFLMIPREMACISAAHQLLWINFWLCRRKLTPGRLTKLYQLMHEMVCGMWWKSMKVAWIPLWFLNLSV